MNDELQALAESPTLDNYLRLRELLLESPDFSADMAELERLTRFCLAERGEEALRLADEMFPRWLLSSRFHYWAACAAEMTGDAEDAELERFLSTTCLEAILATGAGTRESPFVVTYPSDVRDVLLFRRLRIASQQLTEEADGFRDRVLCQGPLGKGGREVWFDCDAILRAGCVANWSGETLPLTVAAGRRW